MTTQMPSLCLDASSDALQELQGYLLPPLAANRLAELFKALSDPTRLRIIGLLAEHEVCVQALGETLGMSQPAISHQLRYLRQLHLVRYRKEGRHVFYALDDDHVRILLAQGLLHVEHG